MDKKTVYRGLKDLSGFLDTLNPWTAETIEKGLAEWHERNQEAWSKRNMYILVRKIATGRKASPPLFESMETVGKAFCQDRFRGRYSLPPVTTPHRGRLLDESSISLSILLEAVELPRSERFRPVEPASLLFCVFSESGLP